MSIEQSGIVDFIADDSVAGLASLVITDHLRWGLEVPNHLYLLQEKLNTYIRFVESGEIYEGREHLRNRKLVLKVVGLYPLPEEAEEFYRRAQEVLQEIDLELSFELNAHALDEK